MSIQFTAGRFSATATGTGAPLVGGLLYTYLTGTSTPQATYTDSTLGTPNTNPIVLNARGEASVWLGPNTYLFILQDSLGNTIWSNDGVVDSANSNDVAIRADLANTSSPTKGPALQGYNSTLSYMAGTVGFELNKRKSVFGTGNAAIDMVNIQNAISGSSAYTTIELFGNFTTNNTITVKPQLKLVGSYCNITHTNANADLFSYTPGTPTGFPGQIIFDKLSITGPGNTGTANAIKIDANCPFVNIRHCYIGGFFGSVYLRDCYSSVIDHCQMYTFSHGVRLLRESHATTIKDTLIDGCTIAGVSINYGGGAGTGPTHNVNVIGGSLQNSAVGLWAENSLELHTNGIYHESNSVNDYRLGVADSGSYLRACYNVVIDGFNSSSPCGSDRNIRIEHSVGVEIRAAGWNTGCSATGTLLSYDGFSDRIDVQMLRYSTSVPTTTAPVDFTADTTRGVLWYRGRPIYGAGQADSIQWGTLASGGQLGALYHQSFSGRDSIVVKSAKDVRLMGGSGGIIRLLNSSGNDIAVFDVSGASLPSANPGTGSKQVWYDPADSNRLKYAP